MNEAARKAIEFALQNRVHNDEATRRMIELAEKQSDWTVTCPKCKRPLKGTLEQIREHKCGG